MCHWLHVVEGKKKIKKKKHFTGVDMIISISLFCNRIIYNMCSSREGSQRRRSRFMQRRVHGGGTEFNI